MIFARNYEKRIILGTSDAWSMRQLSQKSIQLSCAKLDNSFIRSYKNIDIILIKDIQDYKVKPIHYLEPFLTLMLHKNPSKFIDISRKKPYFSHSVNKSTFLTPDKKLLSQFPIVKFIFSKKATDINKISTVDLTL